MEDAKEVLTKIAQTNESKVPEDIEVKLEIVMNELRRFKLSFDFLANRSHIF